MSCSPPLRRRRSRVGVFLAAALLTVLAACSSPSPLPGPTVEPSTVAATPAPTPLATVALTDPYTLPSGVTVRVTEITEAKLAKFPETDAPDAKEGDPYLIITMVLSNGGTENVSVYPTTELRYGADSTPAYRVYVGELDEITVRPKIPYEHAFGVIVPEASRSSVTLDVTMTDSTTDRPFVRFAGSVVPTR